MDVTLTGCRGNSSLIEMVRERDERKTSGGRREGVRQKLKVYNKDVLARDPWW